MKKTRIPITRPYFTKAEKDAVSKVIDSGWVVQGPKVAEFERQFVGYTKTRYAIATSSCTTALHLALIASGIKPGDEVIVPAFTFVATANVVEYLNAKPVFIDIDLQTFNIDPNKLEDYLKKKSSKRRTMPKAIIPVHLFGLSADMDPIMEVANRYQIKIIEDAACGLGTKYKGRHVGTFGKAGCFSFHPRKAITTGEGGMIVTNNETTKRTCEALRNHGAATSDIERHRKGDFALPEYNLLGYNYRMTDIQAAIGIEQMKKLNSVLNKRIKLAERYNEKLSGIKHFSLPITSRNYRHTYQSYVVLVKDSSPYSRDEIALGLAQKGISTRQGTQAVHMLGYYQDKYKLKPMDYPNAFKADRQTLTLPLFAAMTLKEQDFIINTLKRLLLNHCGRMNRNNKN